MSEASKLKGLRRLSTTLDSLIPLPGGRSIGLDGLIGLVPGYGDALGVLMSGYIIVQAARMGVPKAVLGRMIVNVGAEAIIGIVPLLGDLFDFVWKANDKNMSLVEAAMEDPKRTHRNSVLVVAGAAAGVVTLLAIPLVLALAFLGWLINAIFGG